MRTIEDRLAALSTTPAPAPPALDDLRARAQARRRHRVSTAAGAMVVLVALAVLAWSSFADTDATPNVVAGPTADNPTSDPCAAATLAPQPSSLGGSVPIDDPMRLACLALQYYNNNEPPAAIRLGRVNTATFQDWQHQHTGGIGPLNGPDLPDTVEVLLVRTSGSALWAPRPRVGSSEPLRGDTIYVVFTDGLSPEGVSSSGTGTWSEILASPWAQELEQVEVD